MSRLAMFAFRNRPVREWAIPLAAPLLLALLGLSLWFMGFVAGPRRNGLLLGSNAIRSGLPSLYFLACGLISARGAASRGRRADAYAAAALAVGLTVLLFIALYPAPFTPSANPMQRAIEAVPRGLVSWIGVTVGALLSIPLLAMTVFLGTHVNGILSDVTVVLVTSVVGLAASAAAGCITGLALALLEARASRTTGRFRGHMAWMAVAAMCVYASLRIPSFPGTLALAMAGLAVHAYRMSAPPQGAEAPGGGVPVVLCWLVLAWASFVALASGPGRLASQYVVYVP